MYRHLFRLATCVLLTTAACRQQVVVYEFPDASNVLDAGQDSDAGLVDTGLPVDTGVVDSGLPDATVRDVGTPDTGACDPFCLTGLSVSQATVDVQEVAVISPQVDAAPGVQWTTRIDVQEITNSRAPGRPSLAATDAEIELAVAGTSAANFRVFNVVPWFFETKFMVTVHAREVGRAFELSLSTEITVRGNVLMSSGTGGRVYAVGSDGRPATGGGRFENGTLLSLLVSAPRSMWLSDDGTLLVHDDDGSPKRIKRFELKGPDSLLSELQYLDGNQQPLFRSGSLTYGMTQLSDGRVIFPEYSFAGPSNDPKSRLMIWGGDGQFDRSIWAPSPSETWRAVAQTPDGELLVADRGAEAIERYDPATWLADGTFLDQLPGSPAGLLATADALFIGGADFIVTAPWAGGRAAISGLPSSSASWQAFTAYEGGRVLAARATQNSTGNVAVIENRSFVRWFRQAGGPIISPYGLVYLR